jgi:hypothetical protein
MSTITISLPPETEKKLRDKAGSAGVTLEVYLGRLAEHHANGAVPRDTATLDEILAPVRDGFAASGLTEEELAREFEAAREEVWQEKQARKTGP